MNPGSELSAPVHDRLLGRLCQQQSGPEMPGRWLFSFEALNVHSQANTGSPAAAIGPGEPLLCGFLPRPLASVAGPSFCHHV